MKTLLLIITLILNFGALAQDTLSFNYWTDDVESFNSESEFILEDIGNDDILIEYKTNCYTKYYSVDRIKTTKGRTKLFLEDNDDNVRIIIYEKNSGDPIVRVLYTYEGVNKITTFYN